MAPWTRHSRFSSGWSGSGRSTEWAQGRAELLVELRALLAEAETWSVAEGGDAGERAVARLRDSLAHDMIAV